MEDEPVLSGILTEPGTTNGAGIALREGKRYERSLLPATLPRNAEMPIRRGGACLIIGGGRGNLAIIKAMQAISSIGVLDMSLVAGAMTELSPMELQGFLNLGALAGRAFQDQPDKAYLTIRCEARGLLDYLNARGTSSPLGDVTEIKTIESVFPDSADHLWINSTKSLTGHCLSSAGVKAHRWKVGAIVTRTKLVGCYC